MMAAEVAGKLSTLTKKALTLTYPNPVPPTLTLILTLIPTQTRTLVLIPTLALAPSPCYDHRQALHADQEGSPADARLRIPHHACRH